MAKIKPYLVWGGMAILATGFGIAVLNRAAARFSFLKSVLGA